ncbi:hypothetical protein K438DRAFT_2073535 [Mycena galopus ATCC 62051]|nr:hypothetical protein K438DRAFT_2073535 [Mycena galopus ATCC 62051]
MTQNTRAQGVEPRTSACLIDEQSPEMKRNTSPDFLGQVVPLVFLRILEGKLHLNGRQRAGGRTPDGPLNFGGCTCLPHTTTTPDKFLKCFVTWTADTNMWPNFDLEEELLKSTMLLAEERTGENIDVQGVHNGYGHLELLAPMTLSSHKSPASTRSKLPAADIEMLTQLSTHFTWCNDRGLRNSGAGDQTQIVLLKERGLFKQGEGFKLEPVDTVEEAHESQFLYEDERDAIDHNPKTYPLDFSAPNGKKFKPKDEPLSAPLFLAILSTSVSAPPTNPK